MSLVDIIKRQGEQQGIAIFVAEGQVGVVNDGHRFLPKEYGMISEGADEMLERFCVLQFVAQALFEHQK